MGGSILVVEDEAAVRDLLAANLQRAGYKVMCAGDVPQAEALVRDTRPDLVLLDWVLPGIPGLTFARRLRSDQRTKDISIVLLTARAEEQDKVTALESGCDDYVTKPFSARELLARIKAVMRRRAPQLADDVVEIAGLRIDPAAHQVSAGDKAIDLWTTELRLLHFFMTHPGRVFSRARLLDEVWGEHVFVEERTVDVHIRRLRQALAPSGHDKLIETVRGTGYRFKPDFSTANLAGLMLKPRYRGEVARVSTNLQQGKRAGGECGGGRGGAEVRHRGAEQHHRAGDDERVAAIGRDPEHEREPGIREEVSRAMSHGCASAYGEAPSIRICSTMAPAATPYQVEPSVRILLASTTTTVFRMICRSSRSDQLRR